MYSIRKAFRIIRAFIRVHSIVIGLVSLAAANVALLVIIVAVMWG